MSAYFINKSSEKKTSLGKKMRNFSMSIEIVSDRGVGTKVNEMQFAKDMLKKQAFYEGQGIKKEIGKVRLEQKEK